MNNTGFEEILYQEIFLVILLNLQASLPISYLEYAHFKEN
jgi:hypothetical protein